MICRPMRGATWSASRSYAGVQLAMVGVGAPRDATIVLSNPFLV